MTHPPLPLDDLSKLADDWRHKEARDTVRALVERVRALEEGLRGALNIVDRSWHSDPVYKHLRALLAK